MSAAAAGLTAVLVVPPLVGGGSPAFWGESGAWAAVPEAATQQQFDQIMDVCQADVSPIEVSGSTEFSMGQLDGVAVEMRGEAGWAMFRGEENGHVVRVGCLVMNQTVAAKYVWPDDAVAPASGLANPYAGVLDVTDGNLGSAADARTVGMFDVAVGPDVVSVLLTLPDGVEITATVAGDIATAWWPDPVAVAQTFPEEDGVVTVSEPDSTDVYVDVTTTLQDGTVTTERLPVVAR